MNAPELPDDMRSWPADPFALLGVARGASEKDIKRAYTRLIRRFKPEHAPDQFRRIREAYETCLVQFRWFTPSDPEPDFSAPQSLSPPTSPRPAPDVSPPGPAADSPPTEPAPRHELPPPTAEEDNRSSSGTDEGTDEAPHVSPAETSSALRPDAEASPFDEPRPTDSPRQTQSPPPGDEVDHLWAAAVAGQDADAYAGLTELASTRPDRADIPLRLYWLLGLSPAIDHTRTRHAWLADALRRSQLSGPAAELYRRELDADPNASLYGHYLDVLDQDATTRDRMIIARWRLAAAGRSRSWHPASADLQILARRVPFEDEVGWLGFLVAAIEWAAWERPNPLYSRARDELAQLRHLELRHSYAFDRVEETEHVTAGWGTILGELGTPGLFELLPAAWAGSLSPVAVNMAIAHVVADPKQHLYAFDRLARQHGPTMLIILIRGLEQFRQTHGPHDEPDFPSDLIRGLARHLPGGWDRPYPNLRSDLLNFLLAEAIHPTEFVNACEYHPNPDIRERVSSIREDPVLGLVWLACRIHQG